MSSIIPKENRELLEREYNLIRLLHHRNKNQHRVAVWWKNLNSLKRYLTKLLPLLNRKPNQFNINKALKIAKFLKNHIVKACFRSFNEIIALGQFITLGMTLLGLLARVNHELLQIRGINETIADSINTVKNTENFDLGPDSDLGEELGEVIEEVRLEERSFLKRVHIDDDLQKRKKKPEKQNKLKEKSSKSSDFLRESNNKKELFPSKLSKVSNGLGEKEKKKKKKKRSAIDDIFG
ncbi:hypothetical protein WICMUC_000471 [Wickerhamomyces mucosus]|uniref:RNase MRP protein 1 RNA binding domain-containing protein n=1 Tax=Wickerhamomyces mucosus TaxID=1378264 RepID=A0A9P8TIM3_9ASCO|nr:hypothetical protein WICMUC_000471 [Wickerhamomyces mucosus]